jgi:hypothetical protein
MSFVRAKREIETVDVFPKSARDEAKGLGDWPLLQSYAYHWGVEVRFDPALDEVFGITNDKQTVRPIEDLWRVLVAAEVDDKLRAENRNQEIIRRKPRPAKAEASEEPSAAEKAAAGADTVSGDKPKVPEHERGEAHEDFENAAKKRVGVTSSSIEQARKAVEAEARRRPYKIDFFDDPAGPFYKPVREDGQRIVAQINRQHPFFTTVYGPLLKNAALAKAKEGIDLVLLALARGELTVENETTAEWYEAQRERRWSPFLKDALRVLERTLQPAEEETAEAEAEAAEGTGEEAPAEAAE